MKTREHYEKLLADYVAIIPKTAPAYELLEAIQDLINSMEPSRNVYQYHHHALELPEGWRIVNHPRGYALYDDNGCLFGTSTPTYGDNEPAHYMVTHGGSFERGYSKDSEGVTNYVARTQLEALQYLCKEAF